MKAILCHSFGSPHQLELGEIDPPGNPGKHEVLIDVNAAGVNFPDTLIVQGKYQFQPEFPFSPGGEVAGVVRAVGAGVAHLKAGDRVFSGTGWGGFADQVIARAANTFRLPEEVSYEIGAVLPEAYGTSYHALVDRALLKEGESLLVLGASGGVGIAAIQYGKVLGSQVIAAASSDEKLAFCRAHGADHVINYNEENLKEKVRELTGGKGVDVIYDPVGGAYTEEALRTSAWGGRLLVVGFAAGDIPRIPLNLPLLKGCSLVGVFWGRFFQEQPDQNRYNFNKIVEMVKDQRVVPPIQKVYSLPQAPEAMQAIIDRKVMGKVVINLKDAQQ